MKKTPIIRCLIFAALCVAAFASIGIAGQTLSLTDGVYSNTQAERAGIAYQSQCAACHGESLQGAGAGPPLTGDSFLSNWSGRKLSDLESKIEKTMPFDAPGSLSRQQATDLTAYILKAGKFPAGQTDLNEGTLTQVAFPGAKPSSNIATSLSGLSYPPPLGNLAEFMRAVAFYNANIIFNLQLKDPTNEPKPEMPVPYDYVKWGYTIYPGWLAVDQAAVALTETMPLLLTPGRRCQNGRPAPVDRADWKKYVSDVIEVSKLAYEKSKARDYEAFMEISGKLTDACGACHKVYRDAGGSEGSGGDRCQVKQ